MPDFFLVTCEHGGNRIPARYRRYFAGREALLRTHRGYDPGALAMARELAQQLNAPLYYATVSRLLIDLNRSIGHPRLYSGAVRDAGARREILERYYLPYRSEVEAAIAQAVAQGARVVHFSSHSFTPVLDGEVRNADVGLLYDPGRAAERELCVRWRAALQRAVPEIRVRRNYPYAGKSDGFTSYLRRRFGPGDYVGIELEINQRHVFHNGRPWREQRAAILAALRAALQRMKHGRAERS